MTSANEPSRNLLWREPARRPPLERKEDPPCCAQPGYRMSRVSTRERVKACSLCQRVLARREYTNETCVAQGHNSSASLVASTGADGRRAYESDAVRPRARCASLNVKRDFPFA